MTAHERHGGNREAHQQKDGQGGGALQCPAERRRNRPREPSPDDLARKGKPDGRAVHSHRKSADENMNQRWHQLVARMERSDIRVD